PRTVPTPLAPFPARSRRIPSPRGVTLIMSPWNYPFLLALDPLVDAVAAGNTVILKPSAYAPHTAALVERLVRACFEPQHAAVVTGGREENTCLLQQRFDHIFFTGSQAVGKTVMAAASEHLTPVTLELGGKSPCVVERTANIPLAARRIVFGKFLNCGQTCVAPDYILCDRAVHDRLVEEIQRQIALQFGPRPLENPDYGRIINQKHFDRLTRLLPSGETVHGGGMDPDTLRIEPTVLDNVRFCDPVMEEEIFGPILPILTYSSLDEALAEIEARPHPLAFYLFTENHALARQVMARCGFGGGCVNDVVIHLATHAMPFGGFGESGMGAYHGKAGFETFSHIKSVVDKKTWLDLPMRYQPYRTVHEKLIRLFLR
ncbi:MAG: aldehyde dehydrogenase family protein, partial [Oscillospiraceae bacterium]|nr:aldehyde dehydrogenase family protein [Oscillospiraceae bacterium]